MILKVWFKKIIINLVLNKKRFIKMRPDRGNMSKFELKRGDVIAAFEGNLFLASGENNNKAFRKLCKEYGAKGVFSSEIKNKKDIDFEDENIIAMLSGAKMLADLEKNDSVKAYCLDIESTDFEKVIEKTKKPIIVLVNAESKLDNLKLANGIFVNGSDKEALDYKLVEEIAKKVDVPIMSRSKLITPEESYGIVRKTNSKAVVLGDIAFRQPVIFEQTTNYFEKGYYNKITRKRREKTVELFEQLYSEMENTNISELNKFKDIFMND